MIDKELEKILEYEKLISFYDKLKSFISVEQGFKEDGFPLVCKCKLCSKKTEIGKICIVHDLDPKRIEFVDSIYKPWYEANHNPECKMNQWIKSLQKVISFPKYSNDWKDYLPPYPKESKDE